MTNVVFERRRWWLFVIVSALFFHITASTFTSLGVVMPFMIEELSWSWTQAGFGFTLLSLLVGLSGRMPAWTLRKFGIKATFGIGGLLMAIGFCLLALTTGLYQFYAGASILGVGYALCATVPAIHMLNNWMPDRRAFAIGTYMTIGGLGGVAGPLMVTFIVEFTGSWRVHWWLMTITILLLALLAVIFVTSEPDESIRVDEGAETPKTKRSDKVYITEVDWNFREVLRVPQYYIIVFAMTMVLFCEVSLNSWQPTHLATLGYSAGMAALALSAHQAFNALSRGLGGALASRIDPKWLLVSALAAEIVGMWALAVASNPIIIAVFAFGAGYGFGMCLLSTAILLVNYFGPRDNPEILGTMHLFTTFAALAPVMGGYIGDTVGSFAIVFQSYSVVLLVVLVLAILMKPPKKPVIPQSETQPTK